MSEVDDLPRFANPRELMAYLGLAPPERSSGQSRQSRSRVRLSVSSGDCPHGADATGCELSRDNDKCRHAQWTAGHG